MQHRFRFLATPRLSDSSIWEIRQGEELQHLRKVLRLQEGAELEVCDGLGRWGIGALTAVGKDLALVKVSRVEIEEEAKPAFLLGVGALQQSTMADLLPFLVELGVDEIHIFLQDGVAKHRLSEGTIERWQRILLSSLKQCKRARLPLLHTWPSLTAFLAHIQTRGVRGVVLDPESQQSLGSLVFSQDQAICLVLGGEKGFLPSERQLLDSANFSNASLGSYILRAITAAIAAAALISSKRLA
jgi:16S rRNA (uracil1498-N3)-methyltransferase